MRRKTRQNSSPSPANTFSAPDLLAAAFPAVYAQLALFYRQDPLARLQQLQASNPDYQVRTEDSEFATNG